MKIIKRGFDVIAEVDGFEFKQQAGGLFLRFESERLGEYVEYCNDKSISQAIVSRYNSYALDDINFLKLCPSIVELQLLGSFSDYSGVYSLPELKRLAAVFKHSIQIAKIPSLVEFSTDWSAEIDDSMFSHRSLERLWMRYYKPPSRNLTRFHSLSTLRELSVLISPIQTTQGIESLINLVKLELCYCSKLTDIKSVTECPKLQMLNLEHCKKIIDREACFAAMSKLRSLSLSDLQPLANIHFVKAMPGLEGLSFVGTTIEDGDLSPCFNLKNVGFLKKRGYSHTPEQIAEEIAKRQTSV